MTWIRGTTTPQIKSQFGNVSTTKEVWDFLITRYSSKKSAIGCKIFCDLTYLRQQPEQSVHDFLSEIQPIWDQLALSKLVWDSIHDVEKFAAYKDGVQVYQFLMALNVEFEAVRASLLHQNPILSIEKVILKVLSEDTRLVTFKVQRHILVLDTIIAAISFCHAHSKKIGRASCRERVCT